jgi:hypothetical protein
MTLLAAGVVDFDKEEMRIATGEGCEPARWQWQREGSQMKRTAACSLLSNVAAAWQCLHP